MARVDADLGLILEKMVAKIQASIPESHSSNTYISFDPEAVKSGRPGDFFYVVSPRDGNFDNVTGGGQICTWTETHIIVTIHSINQLDRDGVDENFLTHQSKGIVDRATKVLKVFTADDVYSGVTSGDELSAEPVIPVSFNTGRTDDRKSGWFQIVFRVSFDWDLS